MNKHIRYSFKVIIEYQPDTDNIYVELLDVWNGKILAGGTATASERQAVLNCLDYMLKEHLPACKDR